MPETERRKAVEEMKTRAEVLMEVLFACKLRGKWRRRFYVSQLSAFAAKEVEQATEQCLKFVEETPLGYRTEAEHAALEKFADAVAAKIRSLLI